MTEPRDQIADLIETIVSVDCTHLRHRTICAFCVAKAIRRHVEADTEKLAKERDWLEKTLDRFATEVDRLRQAEAAVERAKTTIAALRHMAAAANDDGDTGLSDDHYVGVERAADAIAAALGQPPAEKEEDPSPDHDPATLHPGEPPTKVHTKHLPGDTP